MTAHLLKQTWHSLPCLVQNTWVHPTAGTGGTELFEMLLKAFLSQLKMGEQLKIKQNAQPNPVWALPPAQYSCSGNRNMMHTLTYIPQLYFHKE